MPVIHDVLVIGAGPAGLTAAYELTKHRRQVVVLEADPSLVGGISRTVNYKGFLFDVGGHRFFSKAKEVVDLWNEILPDDFIERPRLSRIYYNGKFYSYPLKAFEALLNLGLWQSARCLLSYAIGRAFPVREPRTFHEWVRNQFGERLYSIFFKTYTEKVWGMSCDDISADWAAQRIKGLSLSAAIWDGLRRSLGAKPKVEGGPVIKTLIESFRYPRRGPGMMWEAAASRVKQNGGHVLMGRTVDGLVWDRTEALWRINAVTDGGRNETYVARHVISSAPLRDLVPAIRPIPVSAFRAKRLKYRDFLTVALIANTPNPFPDNWIYIHDPSIRVGRVQNFRSWSPDMVPDEFHTCLGLEYFCFEGDALWTASDEELIQLATAEIAKIGLVAAKDVVDACVVRQARAYPVYDDDYRENVRGVRDDLQANYPSLHLVGRNGMHKYNNQDHAMMTAMLVTRNILAGERVYDVWALNEDAEYAEAGSEGHRELLKTQPNIPRCAA